ncbi:MAG: hypothetical protein OQK12_13000 [Motiliproteus sp.]|nr:hypothetical protein [Motiliproteus sp.]MCW9052576.1 hypothetical protein [Motiliproteus sp.]
MALRSHSLLYHNDTLTPLPKAKFERFYFKGSAEFPQYAGQNLYVAHFVLEATNVEITGTRNQYFSVHRVAEDGSPDEAFRAGQDRLIQLRNAEDKAAAQGNLINASDQFERKRLERTYDWQPDHALMQRMIRMLFDH